MEDIALQTGFTEKESKRIIRATLSRSLKLFYKSELSSEEVIDLIPVKPIKEYEKEIETIFQTNLLGLYEKIKPWSVADKIVEIYLSFGICVSRDQTSTITKLRQNPVSYGLLGYRRPPVVVKLVESLTNESTSDIRTTSGLQTVQSAWRLESWIHPCFEIDRYWIGVFRHGRVLKRPSGVLVN